MCSIERLFNETNSIFFKFNLFLPKLCIYGFCVWFNICCLLYSFCIHSVYKLTVNNSVYLWWEFQRKFMLWTKQPSIGGGTLTKTIHLLVELKLCETLHLILVLINPWTVSIIKDQWPKNNTKVLISKKLLVWGSLSNQTQILRKMLGLRKAKIYEQKFVINKCLF